jgi:hypothetical protein
MKMGLPTMWKNEKDVVPPAMNTVPYPVHHIQYRSIFKIKPLMNMNMATVTKLQTPVPNHVNLSTVSKPRLAALHQIFNKPQYKKKTVFKVSADSQYDVYYLHAFDNVAEPRSGGDNIPFSEVKGDKVPLMIPRVLLGALPPIFSKRTAVKSLTNDKHVFVDVAFIPNYQTSKMMNCIFRKVKENDNLDYIEESDDEEDFENTQPDKYVDLKKRVNMECQFHFKFKRWVPLRVIDPAVNYGKIVPITNL